jgi:hypothetical protein
MTICKCNGIVTSRATHPQHQRWKPSDLSSLRAHMQSHSSFCIWVGLPERWQHGGQVTGGSRSRAQPQRLSLSPSMTRAAPANTGDWRGDPRSLRPRRGTPNMRLWLGSLDAHSPGARGLGDGELAPAHAALPRRPPVRMASAWWHPLCTTTSRAASIAGGPNATASDMVRQRRLWRRGLRRERSPAWVAMG